MKRINTIYWIFTVLLAVLMGVGAIPDIISTPEAVTLFNHLGYPAYLNPFLGVAKLLGVIAILIPGYPRLKEWAYAGLTFDLAGAMYSSIAIDDKPAMWSVFIIGFIIIAVSYIYHHKRQKARASLPLNNNFAVA